MGMLQDVAQKHADGIATGARLTARDRLLVGATKYNLFP